MASLPLPSGLSLRGFAACTWLPFLYVVALSAFPATDSTHAMDCCFDDALPVTVNGTLLCRSATLANPGDTPPHSPVFFPAIRGLVVVSAFAYHAALTLLILVERSEALTACVVSLLVCPVVFFVGLVAVYGETCPSNDLLSVVGRENTALFTVFMLQSTVTPMLIAILYFNC